MKKMITMQDISCVGKCSLTAALPVLSVLGIEAVPLPTAVLSTHTMFQSPHIHDLTESLLPIMDHWKKENFRFDGICTGYLASIRQIDIAVKLIHDFPCALRVVDPCMADHGRLYAGFDLSFVRKMKELCCLATIICPNLTEACLLTDTPYRENMSEKEIDELAIRLTQETGCACVVITGISITAGKIGAILYNSSDHSFYHYETVKEPQSFHGTGDLWAAVFSGCLLNGKSSDQAIQTACQFVDQAIACTLKEENHNTYGTNFEEALPFLIQRS